MILYAVKGDSGVAGEGRVVGIPKFHSWGKFTMPLMNINSDRMSKAFSDLCIRGNNQYSDTSNNQTFVHGD